MYGQTLVVILRHNVGLATDLMLARREFDALLRQEGTPIAHAQELHSILGSTHISRRIRLATGISAVGFRYNWVPLERISNLALRSGFAQELLVLAEEETITQISSDLCLPSMLINELSSRILLIPSLYYLVESEGVFAGDQSNRSDRLKHIGALLLSNYAVDQPSSQAKHLRQAIKTSLCLTHDLHIYKAKFFPRMVRALLNVFAEPGATVLDPYCGSGTALLEASLLGMNSIGIDIDPICKMISDAKVTPFLEFISHKGRHGCFGI